MPTKPTGILILTNGVEVTEQEYQSLLATFAKIVKNEKYAIAEKAVYLQRCLSNAIKNKLAGNIFANFDYKTKLPSPDKTKASVIRGMFFAFLEQEKGFPGFFKIMKSISSSVLGFGTISFASSATTFTKVRKIIEMSNAKDIILAQSSILENMLEKDMPSRFASIERGMSCVVLAASFLPIYAALIAIDRKSEHIDENDLNNAMKIVLTRFSPESKKLTNLFSQALFAQLFTSLFSHESTVISIFAI